MKLIAKMVLMWMLINPILSFSSAVQVETEETATLNQDPIYRLKDSPQNHSDPVSSEKIGTLFIGLIGILSLILLLAWVSRKLKWSGMTAGNAIKIVTFLNVGPKEKLIIVDIDDQRLLLGVTQNSISLVKELTADSDTPNGVTEAKKDSQIDNSFSKTIQSLLAKGTARHEDP